MKESEVVEAAEDVVVDLIFHELHFGVEGVCPDDGEILDGLSVVGVPVEVFGDQEGEFGVHLDYLDVFVGDVGVGLGGHFQGCGFVSEIVDFGEGLSEGHCHLLGFVLLEVLYQGFDQVRRFGFL